VTEVVGEDLGSTGDAVDVHVDSVERRTVVGGIGKIIV
jgi:hypothetical protein